MAKQIKRSEIAEKDLYKEIRDSAIETIQQIDVLNETLKDTAVVVKKELQKPLQATMKDINSVNTSVEVMNNTMEQSIKLDKAKSEAIKTQIKAEQELEKLKQAEIKTEEQLVKLMQQELRLEQQERKATQEQIKQQKQKQQLTDEEIRDKIKLQRANQERKKELTDILILEDKEAGTLEKLSAKNRQLRREREKLNLETQEGQKRLKEINDELDENNEVIKENSDALKQQKLNVGNYTDSIVDATGELGGLIKSIKGSIDGLKDQAKAFMVQAKAADTSSKKIKLVGKAIKASGIGLLIALLGSLFSSMADTREGVTKLQGTMQKVSASISMLGNKLQDYGTRIALFFEKLNLKAEEFFNGFGDTPEIQNRLKEIEGILTDLDKKDYSIKATFDQIDNAIKKTFEYENALASTNKELQEALKQEELLSEQTGDMTLSFAKQLKAQELYNKQVEDRIGIEKKLADLNVEAKAIQIQASLSKAGKQYNLQQIKNLEFLGKESEWMKLNSDQLMELKDAQTEQFGKENELSILKAKNAMERRNTLKDLFEKELDYAIDAFDVNKTINERIINNEKTTLAERDALTEETRQMSDKAYANQIKLVEDYTGQKIDFASLVEKTDEAEIRGILKKNDLNETTLTRILEIIKERKIALQDLEDLELETANKRLEMTKSINESIQNIEQDDFDLKVELLEKDFDKQRELRSKSLEDEKIKGAESLQQLKDRLDKIKEERIKQLKDQAQYEKDALDLEIMEDEERAQKKKEIDEKLANDIIRIDQEILDEKQSLDDEEVEAEKTKNEKLKELDQQRVQDQIAILQQLTEYSNRLIDKRIEKIDEEMAKSQERYDQYEQLAQEGNILASQSMAEEQRLMAEQQRQREKMEKKKQRMQLASTVLQTYLQNQEDPDVKNPLQKTITDTILLTEFINSLPTFFDGIEDTGKHGRGVDGKGGFQAILHPNERVLTKKQNEMVGSLSNEELSQLAYNYQNGLVRDITDGVIVSNGLGGTNLLIDKLSSLEATIRNKPETNIELEQIVDGAMAITRTTKKGNTKIYNRYRVGR